LKSCGCQIRDHARCVKLSIKNYQLSISQVALRSLDGSSEDCGQLPCFLQDRRDSIFGKHRRVENEFQPENALVDFLDDNPVLRDEFRFGTSPAGAVVIGANGECASDELIADGPPARCLRQGVHQLDSPHGELPGANLQFRRSHGD